MKRLRDYVSEYFTNDELQKDKIERVPGCKSFYILNPETVFTNRINGTPFLPVVLDPSKGRFKDYFKLAHYAADNHLTAKQVLREGDLLVCVKRKYAGESFVFREIGFPVIGQHGCFLVVRFDVPANAIGIWWFLRTKLAELQSAARPNGWELDREILLNMEIPSGDVGGPGVRWTAIHLLLTSMRDRLDEAIDRVNTWRDPDHAEQHPALREWFEKTEQLPDRALVSLLDYLAWEANHNACRSLRMSLAQIRRGLKAISANFPTKPPAEIEDEQDRPDLVDEDS